jgi:hypothetical protein
MAGKNIWTPPFTAESATVGVSTATFNVSNKAAFIPNLNARDIKIATDMDVGKRINGMMPVVTVEGYTPLNWADLAIVGTPIILNSKPNLLIQTVASGLTMPLPPFNAVLTQATFQYWNEEPLLATNGGTPPTFTLRCGDVTSIANIFVATTMADINLGCAVSTTIPDGWSASLSQPQTGIGPVPNGTQPVVSLLMAVDTLARGSCKVTVTYELIPVGIGGP